MRFTPRPGLDLRGPAGVRSKYKSPVTNESGPNESPHACRIGIQNSNPVGFIGHAASVLDLAFSFGSLHIVLDPCI